MIHFVSQERFIRRHHVLIIILSNARICDQKNKSPAQNTCLFTKLFVFVWTSAHVLRDFSFKSMSKRLNIFLSIKI